MKLYVFLYGTTIDVILTAENQSYVRIKKRTVNAPCSSWTHKNTFGVIVHREIDEMEGRGNSEMKISRVYEDDDDDECDEK